VPVTAADPEVSWLELAAAYGAGPVASHVDPAPPHTGGRAVMFTGLSGAGKSTIAGRLVELLVEAGHTVTLLDGDEVRTHLSAGLGFSKADRDTNVRRIGWVAAQIAKHGGLAVCAPIAPYAATRAEARRLVEEQAGPGSFVLVHVATPLDECEARDRKGLYAKARRGEIAEFTGISDPYEEPTDAELVIDTRSSSVDESARRVLEHLTSS
jgi:sulfate adenylyltransferase